MSPALPDIKIFIDCADFASIDKTLALPWTAGYTTNPSLVSQAGVGNYTEYAAKVLKQVPTLPVSFEVLSEDMAGMEREARIIYSWGKNVYVKIPVIDQNGNSMAELIRKLSAEGVPINVTCVFTPEQADIAAASLDAKTPAIISLFAGRLADIGLDPLPLVAHSRKAAAALPRAELLWASTREVYNIWEAARAGCKIITVPPAMAEKLKQVGKTAHQISVEAVQAFMRDKEKAGVVFS